MSAKLTFVILVFFHVMSFAAPLSFERHFSELLEDEQLDVLNEFIQLGGGGPAFGQGAITFLKHALNGPGKVALFASSSWSEVGYNGVPISLVSIAWVRYGENEKMVDTMKAGVWLRSLESGREYQLLSYEARFSFPEDFDAFKEVKNGHHRLLSVNQVSSKSFVLLDGGRQIMISANGRVEDYGNEFPAEQSEAFRKLMKLINDNWQGTRNDLALLLSRP